MTTTVARDDYGRAAEQLANWHRAGGFSDLVVYAFDDPARETVRLVEISSEFPSTGEIVPVTFGKSSYYPFRSTVIQVSRSDWARVEARALSLPEGWCLADKRQVWPQ